MEAAKRPQNYVGDNAASRQALLTDTVYPRLLVTFGGADAARAPLEVDAESFVGVKGFKAKGKRITTWQVERIEELEPLRQPAPEPSEDEGDDNEVAEEENLDPDAGKSRQQVIDEITGQLSLFTDDDMQK